MNPRRFPFRITASQSWLGLVYVLLLSTLAGCNTDATQLILTIDSNLKPVTQLGAIKVHLLDSDDERTFLIGDKNADNINQYSLPISLAIVPPDGDASKTVEIAISALNPDGTTPLFTRNVKVGFRKNAKLLVPIFLSADCPNRTCATDETCTENGCASPNIDVTKLSEIDPGQETKASIRQPGVPGRDAGIVIPYGNQPPSAPILEALPSEVNTLTAVEAKLEQAATDPDGDPLTYRYEWIRNDEASPTVFGALLPADETQKGQQWTVRVYAHDGYQRSNNFATASVRITNSAPTLVVTNTATITRSNEILAFDLDVDDVDRDQLNIRIDWYKNDEFVRTSTIPLASPATITASVSAQDLRQGDIWFARIAASDNEAETSKMTQGILIRSARPVIQNAYLSYSGTRPTTTSSLTLNYEVADADENDTVSQVFIQWTADNQPLSNDQQTILPSHFTRKDQNIRAQVFVVDRFGASSAPVETKELLIENTPPVLFSVDVLPTSDSSNVNCSNEPCTVAEDFVCSVSSSFDADGDPVTLRYAWFDQAETSSISSWIDLMVPTATITSGQGPRQARRGQRLTCVALGFDGESEGPVVNSPSIAVQNSVPQFIAAQLSPRSPVVGDEFRASGLGWEDADGDPEQYRYEWLINGETKPAYSDETLTSTAISKNDVVQVRLIPWDGFNEGLPGTSAPVTVINSQPTIGQIRITPPVATTIDNLVAEPEAAFDPDGDNIEFTYQWYRDGALIREFTGREFPSSETRRDQVLRVEITPHDGDTFGPTASTQFNIVNSPPQAPQVEITPRNPLAEESLDCNIIEQSVDNDGDSVSYSFRWQLISPVRSSSVSFSGPTLPASMTDSQDEWICEVTPNDGTDPGDPKSATRIVQAFSWAAESIHAAGANTCIIRRSPRGVLCWDQWRAWDFQAGDYRGFINNAGALCARYGPDQVHCFEASTSTQTPGSPTVTTTTISPTWVTENIVYAGSSGFCHWNAQGVAECTNPNEQAPPGNYSQLIGAQRSSGTGFFCGLKTDRSVRCWSSSSLISEAPDATEEILELIASSGIYAAAAGRMPNGEWKRWGSSSFYARAINYLPEFSQGVKKRSISDKVSCSLSNSGEALCVSRNGQWNGVDAVPHLIFTDIAVGSSHVCGISNSGNVHCWGSQSTPLLGEYAFQKIVLGNAYACGLSNAGRLSCWGSSGTGFLPNVAGLGGLGAELHYQDVWAKGQDLCAKRTSGVIDCWGEHFQTVTQINPPWIEWSGNAARKMSETSARVNCKPLGSGASCLSPGNIVHGAITYCEMATGGEISCAGVNTEGRATPPENDSTNPFVELEGVNTNHCARKQNGDIQCWGILSSPVPSNDVNDPFVELQYGGGTYCARKQNGQILCWGGNLYGQANSPSNDPNNPFIEVQVTGETNCARRQSGDIVCWGRNNYGSTTPPANDANNPFIEMSIVGSTNCARRQSGDIECWGGNLYGQANPPSNDPNNPFSKMFINGATNCALRQNGDIACWGVNSYEQATPPANELTNPFVDLRFNGLTVCAQRQDGELICWGLNSSGRANPPANSPVNPFTAFALSSEGSCAERQDGTILCWGDTSRAPDQHIYNVGLNDQNREYAFGKTHHCSLRENGTASCSGLNSFGETDAPGGFFERLYARPGQTCGIRSGGSIECWGRNDDLQSSPTNTDPLIELGLAERHACGIEVNTSTTGVLPISGKLVCWGYNGDGRADIPASLFWQDNFTDVDCAQEHCCALNTFGEVSCFGQNLPNDVPMGSGYLELVLHDDGGCVLDALGTPTCWGSDAFLLFPVIIGSLN